MDPLGNMMMILGGLVGFVGAVRVYLKWNSGDQDVQKAVMGWMGSVSYTHLLIAGLHLIKFRLHFIRGKNSNIATTLLIIYGRKSCRTEG